MSELMGDIRAEPKPGTALRIMVEEHRHLDEFMAMVKAKMELDKKYVSELKALRDSWNPAWNESGVWPLISPFLIHINNEIDERENTGTQPTSRFAALPDTPPNALLEDGLDPVEMLERVQITHSQYEQCHKIISTPESVRQLKKWRVQVGDRENWPVWLHEREYRRAVIAHQTVAEWTVKWQVDTLPDILERHQQRAEDVKSFLNELFTCYSSICLSLSTSCSTALGGNGAFSPSRFIAPRHGETEKEASHALLQAVDYHNYMRDGEVTQPIFGLGVEKTASLMNRLLERPRFGLYGLGSYKIPIPSPFVLEEGATWSNLQKLDNSSFLTFARHAFLLDEPLLPLPSEVIMEYRSGISRTKLSSVLDTYLPLARQDVLGVMMKLHHMVRAESFISKRDLWERVTVYLSRNTAAWQIIESIWRKWDISHDCPLPEGAERVWSEPLKNSEVVWKKTGKIYYPSMSNSSA